MNSQQKILVVDDEQDLREILEFNLSSEGFLIKTVASAEEALALPLQEFDLILLDVMMEGISGFHFADILRKEQKLDIPIIFLTAKGSENDLLTGFNLGGDDYISKPFSIKEVVVRIRAVLKRRATDPKEEKLLQHNDLVIDQDKKIVAISRKEIELNRKEYKILLLLMKHKGKYISREEILEKVWSKDVIVTERNVDVTITRLRKKIGGFGTNIKGKTGYGYCFQED